MEEIMKVMTQMMKKKEKAYSKVIILKLFDVIQMILTLIFLNLYAKQICTYQNYGKKAANEVIDKITEDFEKIAAVTKLKELKRYAKNILPNYKKLKTRNQK